jgi:hypothetical protein
LTASLRRDPRFMQLAARLGMVDYWHSSGHWPDFCSEPGLPYDCRREAANVAASRPISGSIGAGQYDSSREGDADPTVLVARRKW